MTEQAGDYRSVLDAEDARRISGDDARTMNIRAGVALADVVRTTLGPAGMAKLLVDSDGMKIVTNSGASIVGEMDIEHPMAAGIAGVAYAQDDEFGDATTTTVVVAGELLREAQELLDRGLHPATIRRGYRRALDRATDVLEERAIEIDADDEERLADVAATAMAGRAAEGIDRLSGLVVDAVRAVADDDGIDLENVGIENVPGGRIVDSRLQPSVVIDHERARAGMPFRVEEAGVAVFDDKLEATKPAREYELHTGGSTAVGGYAAAEVERSAALVDRLVEAGVDAILCSDTVSDPVLDVLAERQVYVSQNLTFEDVRLASRMTGALVLSDLADLTPGAVGRADAVSETTLAGEMRTRVDVEDGSVDTLIVRGGSRSVVEEAHRALEDGLAAVAAALEDGRVLAGGGAPEAELARALRAHADSVGTREQLAVTAFADAIETIPRTLAENTGRSAVDGLLALRSRHHAGERTAGIDPTTGEIVDMADRGVLEPLTSKRGALSKAMEITATILRIDDVLTGGVGGGDDQAEPSVGQ